MNVAQALLAGYSRPISPAAPSETAEQTMCAYLERAEAAAEQGDSCNALVWFDAAIATVEKVPPVIMHLIGMAHKVM